MARRGFFALACLMACGAPPQSGYELERMPTRNGDYDRGDAGDGDPSLGDSEPGDDDHSPGDATGAGDSDGTNATQRMLVVRSAGVEIGYLDGVGEFVLLVWDPELDLFFHINDATGYVAGGGNFYYSSDDCSGDKYVYVAGSTCPVTGATPSRRRVFRDDFDWNGLTEAGELFAQSGGLMDVTFQSYDTANGCLKGASTYCMLAVQPTSEIPTSFALPITITEE